MCMFCLHVSMCTTCVPGAHGGQKIALEDSLKLELEMAGYELPRQELHLRYTINAVKC